LGNFWEIFGKFLEKFLGNFWEIFGKFLGIFRENKYYNKRINIKSFILQII